MSNLIHTKIKRRGFTLLGELALNNDRDWYKANRDDFETELLEPFGAILSAISFRLQTEDMDFHGGKKTMFRMNRDVRFSKDKSPYKTNVSGTLTPSGSKAEGNGIVYLHFETNGGFAAFGRYNLNAKALGPIRDRIIEEPKRFGSILQKLQADGLDLDRTGALSSMDLSRFDSGLDRQ